MWTLLLLAATVWSFAHMPLGLSVRNKIVLWPGCGGRARCSLHTKNVRSVWFVAKRRGCCCNLSGGVALNVWFTTNGMCVKNNTHIHVARTSNDRMISSGELYCCLPPQCKTLRASRSGFPIATLVQHLYSAFFQYIVWHGSTSETAWMQRRQKNWLKSTAFTELKKITSRMYWKCTNYSLFFKSIKFRCCSFYFIKKQFTINCNSVLLILFFTS